MSRTYRGKKRPSHISYLIGILILIAAVAISAKGFLNGNDPSSTAVISQTPSPTPTPTPTPTSNFNVITQAQDSMYQGKLILVNGSHPFKFIDFEKIVNINDNRSSSYRVNDNTMCAGNNTIAPLNSMFDAFYSATGLKNVYLISGYRTLETQQILYNREVADKGATEAGKWVAVPGTSEHHTGLAIDLGLYDSDWNYTEFDGSGKYAWINENCYKYGFVIRYSESKKDITKIYYEPWHLRYIGVAHATQITKLGLCMEEYIDYLRSYSYDKPLQIKTDDGSVYSTYFCAGLNVYVPKSGSYEISGNNVDGFIVTVKVS